MLARRTSEHAICKSYVKLAAIPKQKGMMRERPRLHALWAPLGAPCEKLVAFRFAWYRASQFLYAFKAMRTSGGRFPSGLQVFGRRNQQKLFIKACIDFASCAPPAARNSTFFLLSLNLASLHDFGPRTLPTSGRQVPALVAWLRVGGYFHWLSSFCLMKAKISYVS